MLAAPQLSAVDEIWLDLRSEVEAEAIRTPTLAALLHAAVLRHRRLEDALSFHLSNKLAAPSLQAISVRDLIDEAFADPQLGRAIRDDLRAVKQRDPAAREYSVPFLYFKGFLSLQAYRVAHALWTNQSHALAIYLQNRISEVFGVDIHPAARIGSGILLDHGTGVVIGETAVVGNNVSMLHEVTLGGTGKETGDRHPKVGDGVLIGAGAKVLGNIRIGNGSKIGAGSVVLDDVPPQTTVAGVPARIVGRCEVAQPALDMNQIFPHTFHDGDGI